MIQEKKQLTFATIMSKIYWDLFESLMKCNERKNDVEQVTGNTCFDCGIQLHGKSQ